MVDIREEIRREEPTGIIAGMESPDESPDRDKPPASDYAPQARPTRKDHEMATVTLTQAEIDKTRKTLTGHRELVESTLRNARMTRDRELQLIAERDSLDALIAKFPPAKPKAKKAAKASSK